MNQPKSNIQPGEVICIRPIVLETQKDGKVYMFLAMDVASEFIYQAGPEKEDDRECLLRQLQLLLENKDFLRYKGRPFTLVLPKYETCRSAIEELIQPFNGSLLINVDYVTLKTASAVEYILLQMKQRGISNKK